MSIQQIRRNPDGSVDEVIVSDCLVQLEQMGPDHWWLGIRRGKGKDFGMLHVNFHTRKGISDWRGAIILATVHDEGLGCEDNRAPST